MPPTGPHSSCDSGTRRSPSFRRRSRWMRRFAPFPVHGHEVLSILGAGGFGVAFLCRNRYSGGRVVVKAFEAEGIDRDVATVFREAQILESLRHPGIIRLLDCGFADPVREQRPFLKLEHFEGSSTLDGPRSKVRSTCP